MMAEGMTDEALVLTRVIHDRYHASKRNPFNEIECSDHYARAMASYGTFITACGFEYHGPKGFIRFAPKWDKENSKAPFTAAAGWGSYSQQKIHYRQQHRLEIKHGSIQLQQVSLEKIDHKKAGRITVNLDGQKIPASFTQNDTRLELKFAKRVTIKTNQELVITIQ